MSTLERAIEIAVEAHREQTDKAGERYILHPLRVMLRLSNPDARTTAVLHDVVEDTRDHPDPARRWSLERLREEGFSAEVLAAVDAVTRRTEEVDYFDFIDRAALDPIGRAVKIADIEDNLNLDRIAEPTEADLRRIERYRLALEYLDPATARKERKAVWPCEIEDMYADRALRRAVERRRAGIPPRSFPPPK